MTTEQILEEITKVVHEHVGNLDLSVTTYTSRELSPEKLAAFLAKHLTPPGV